MSKKAKGTNKNQTATARAEQRRAEGQQLTSRTCHAASCPNKGKRIPLGELVPAKVVVGGKGRMRYYHKGCYAGGV
jgi:ribosomal protein L32